MALKQELEWLTLRTKFSESSWSEKFIFHVVYVLTNGCLMIGRHVYLHTCTTLSQSLTRREGEKERNESESESVSNSLIAPSSAMSQAFLIQIRTLPPRLKIQAQIRLALHRD